MGFVPSRSRAFRSCCSRSLTRGCLALPEKTSAPYNPPGSCLMVMELFLGAGTSDTSCSHTDNKDMVAIAPKCKANMLQTTYFRPEPSSRVTSCWILCCPGNCPKNAHLIIQQLSLSCATRPFARRQPRQYINLFCEPHLVAFSNVELHDTLLALVEHWGCHGQTLAPVILLA